MNYAKRLIVEFPIIDVRHKSALGKVLIEEPVGDIC